MDNNSRVAIVTGGGSGIGAACARAFNAMGVRVAVVGRRLGLLEEICAELTQAGGEAMAVSVDLAEVDAPEEVIKQVAARWGRIDYIVNGAAAIDNKPFSEVTAALFDMHMDVNVRAPYMMIHHALPYLNQSPCASVVNISSSSGSLTIPGQSMYGTSKAAVQYITKSLAAELAPKIRVNCIAPGPVDTPIHLVWAGDDVKGAYRRMTSELPLARMGTAEELASWIVWLCNEQSTFVTGAVIPVDGGQALPGALSKISGD